MKIPDSQLVAETLEMLREKEAREGPEAITDIMRVVLVVARAWSDLGNGGFRNFFEQGAPLRATTEACALIGATTVAASLQLLLELFPEQEVPEDYDERMELVHQLYRQHSEQLSRLESNYEAASGMLEHQLAGWINAHGHVFCRTQA